MRAHGVGLLCLGLGLRILVSGVNNIVVSIFFSIIPTISH